MGQYSDLTDAAQASPASATALGARLASETPPDRAAQALQMARRYGLPAGVAETFVDDYKARATMEDNRALLERAPRLQSWVDRNPMRAAAAQDDMPSLAEVERRIAQFGELKAPDPIKPSFSTVASGLFESFTQGFRMMREGARMQAGDMLGLPIEDAQRRYEQARARADASRPEFESSTARGLYGGGESLARMLPSAVASVVLKSTAPVLVAAGMQTQTEAYGKYRTRGATAGEAALGSFGEGAVEVATEKIPMGFLVDRFGKAGAKEFLAGMLLREMPTEQVATLLQDAIDTAVANPDKTWGEYFAERPEAAYQTALGVLVQSSFFGAANTVARRLAKDDDRAQQAEQTALAAEELSKLAEASKLRGRDAESFREFVQQVADEEGDAPTEFYIDGETLVKTLDQSGVTMQELEAIAPVVASQIEAAMTGGDVRVPVSEFLSAGEAVTAPLVDHLRMTPEGMSRAEAQDYMKEQGDRIQREVEAELQRVDDQAQFRQSIEAVRAEFEAELSNARRFTADVNRAYADLLANFYGATAARLGMTPQELLAKYRLRVQSKLADGQRVMEQGAPDTPEFRNWFGDSKVVDQQGRPLVVYHGTGADVSEFRPGVAKAIWFAPDAGYAGKYVSAQEGASNNLIPVFLTVKNPLTVDMRGGANLPRGLKGLLRYANTLEDVVGIARQQGHDGVIFKNRAKTVEGFVADEVAVFEPTQIKSAIGNRGTFDPADPSILNQGETPRAQISLPLNDDGTVTVYHHTTAEKAAEIRRSGVLKSAGEPDLYFTTTPDTTTGYGDTAVPFRVKPERLQLDDEFPGGRQDYRVRAPTKARRVKFRPDGEGILYQGETPRAQIAFPTDITASPSVISLLQGADLSSFIHESGHFFLEVHADLATKIQQQIDAGASVSAGERQIVDDFNRLLEWFGVKGNESLPPLQEWALMSLDEKRQYHEQFARGFEAYAFEGKAPSLELQSVFQRFRSWLLQVYQTLRNLKVELNDDVRAVMGRMLASDFAIEEAEAARNMGALFKSAEQAGMTLDEFNAYQELARGATENAIAALQARGLKDMKWLSRAKDRALKARQQEVEELRREVRQEVRGEVMREPVYRAWQFLTGKQSAADKISALDKPKSVPGPVDNTVDSMFVAIAKMGGLRRDASAADLGIDPKQRSPMPMFGKPLLLRDGGLSQDAMAERLGELGYLTLDENGKVDLAEFQDRFQEELRGRKQYSYAKDYAAMQDVAAGVGLNVAGMESGRLDLGSLIEQYGPNDANVATLKARRMTAKSGLDADIVADQFEFDSGDALVKALAEATPPAEVIEARTDQRMLETFGDITSPEALERAADEAVHNEARARFIAAELKALQDANKVRGEGKNALHSRSTVDVMARAAKDYAQQIIARKKVRDLRPVQFAAAEARNAKLAEKAMTAGKVDEAAMHKRNQLINNYAAKAAYEAQADVKKALEFFGKVNSGTADKIAETRDVALVNVARAVLAEYGIGTKGKTAQEYLATVETNDPELAGVLRDRVDAMTAGAIPYKDLSVERLAGLADEIRSLWTMAKRARQIEIDGKLIDRNRAQMALADRIAELGVPARIPGEGRAVTEAERRTAMLRSAWAALRRVESWVDLKDGDGVDRPFRRYVWQPIRDAADRYRSDKAKYLKAYRDLLKSVNLGRSRIDAPELGYTFGYSRGGSGKQEILHALLHTGNDSNKRKLLVGRGWGRVLETGELDTNRWDTFVRRMVDQGVLTKTDFDFVQGVWDLLEQIKPLAQKAHRDVFGRYFEEVTAASFVDPFGQPRRGGYVPAMADSEVVSDAKTRELVEQENQTLALAFPQTARGFTKARVEYNRPLLLDLRSLGQHIDKVLLFSHLEQPVRDVRKILASKEVAEPLSRAEPAAFDGMLIPWLNRVARQQVETPIAGSNGLMRFFSKARSRAGIAAMFANLSNTAQQITGLSIAAVKVRPRHLLGAAAQMIHSPKKTVQAVAEASPYMATRMDNEVAQMADAINDILLNPSVYERAQTWTAKHAYFMQSAVDNVIGPIVWQGAYNQALEAGESEADARRLADAAVRQTQGSTLPEDIARFESGNSFVRMFTQFAGYFNMQANLLGSEFAGVMRDLGLRKGMGRGMYVFLFGFLAPALVSELIVQAFRGGPGDGDDDGEYLDDWLAALGIGTLRSGVAMVPVIGQISTAAANMANSKPYDDRISTSPAISMIESAVRAPVSVYEAVVNDGSLKKAVRDVATLITMTTGLPATAVARPVGYAADVAQERVELTGPADLVRGAVTGVASPESKH